MNILLNPLLSLVGKSIVGTFAKFYTTSPVSNRFDPFFFLSNVEDASSLNKVLTSNLMSRK